MLNIVFRVDASNVLGVGHVMRCLTLADAFKKYTKANIHFYCAQKAGHLNDYIEQKGFRLTRLSATDLKREHKEIVIKKEANGIDWLVVDHYELGQLWSRMHRSITKKLIVIDDLANTKYDCDILVNQNLGIHPDRYKGLISRSAKLFLGPDYALLRREFVQWRNVALARRAKCTRMFTILVSMGGRDNDNLTLEITQALNNLDSDLNIQVDVVLPRQSLGFKQVSQFLTQSGLMYHLHADQPEMAKLLTQADIAIGSGGITSYERCCLGLPTLLVEAAENQRENILNLVKLGVGVKLNKGKYVVEIQSVLDYFNNQIESYHKMAVLAGELCDGQGAKRFINELGLVKDNPVVVKLRPVTKIDRDLIYTWQVIKGIRRFSRNDQPPTYDEHCDWFVSSLKLKSRVMFIIMCDDSPAGMLRFDVDKQLDEKAYEVSIIIDPDFHRMGVGKGALQYIRNLYQTYCFTAQIDDENQASIKLFTSAGYKKIAPLQYVNLPKSN